MNSVESGDALLFKLAFTPKGGGAGRIRMISSVAISFILAFTPKGGGAVHIDLSDNTDGKEDGWAHGGILWW
jgi:hypothetical protein